jgi:hypothetical protein
MKRIGIIAMCFAAVLAFSAVTIASASATEVLLSSATGTYKATGGTLELIGASKIACSSTASSGTSTDAHLGTFAITLSGCKAGSISCTSTGEASGVIKVTGTAHIGLGMKSATSGESKPGILLLPNETTYSCGILGTVHVRGNIVGLFLKKDGTAVVPPVNLNGLIICFKTVPASSTTQEDTAFLLSLTSPENQLDSGIHLESNIFGGGFKELGLEASSEITETSPAGLQLVNG